MCLRSATRGGPPRSVARVFRVDGARHPYRSLLRTSPRSFARRRAGRDRKDGARCRLARCRRSHRAREGRDCRRLARARTGKLDEFGILARARRRFVRARARSKGALDALDALDALVSFRLDARLDRPDALTTSTTGARGDFRQRAPTRRVHRRQRHQRAVRPAIDVEAISRILAHADEISSAFARDEIGDGVRDTRGVSRGRVRRRAVLRLSSADDERFVWVERSRVGNFSAQILGRIIFI